MKICVYGAASPDIEQDYIDKVEALCKKLGERGHNLIFGGGASGLMGAAARGFHAGGGKVIGVFPVFFGGDSVEELFEGCDHTTWTPDMGVRKQIMEVNCDAFLVVPGGIGTLDEFFQALTLKDLGQTTNPIAVYNINGYYYSLKAMLHSGQEEHFLRKGVDEMYGFFDDGDEDKMIEYLETPCQEMASLKERGYK